MGTEAQQDDAHKDDEKLPGHDAPAEKNQPRQQQVYLSVVNLFINVPSVVAVVASVWVAREALELSREQLLTGSLVA